MAALAIGLAPLSVEAISFTRIPALPGDLHSIASDISADGTTVVGRSFSASGTTRAFVWDRVGGIRSIPGLSSWSSALRVSGDGSTVAGHADEGTFIWDETHGLRMIGPLPGRSSAAIAGLSDDGSTVVGRSGSLRRSFIWDAENGTRALNSAPFEFDMLTYGVSSDGSVVVGWSNAGTGQEAYIWDEVNGFQALGFLPGGNASNAFAISGDGSTVAGGGFTAADAAVPLVWDAEGGMRELTGVIPDFWTSYATDLSDDGSTLVGIGGSDETGTKTFVWDAEHGMRDLAVLLAASGIDLDDWFLFFVPRDEELPRISADGRSIVAFGMYGGYRASYIAVIPEPSTALLVGMGLALCTSRRTHPRSPQRKKRPPRGSLREARSADRISSPR